MTMPCAFYRKVYKDARPSFKKNPGTQKTRRNKHFGYQDMSSTTTDG